MQRSHSGRLGRESQIPYPESRAAILEIQLVFFFFRQKELQDQFKQNRSICIPSVCMHLSLG